MHVAPLKPVRLQQYTPSAFLLRVRFALTIDIVFLTERSVGLPTVDNDQDVIDLMVADVTGLTACTGLVNCGQLAPASIRLLSAAIPTGSFPQVVLQYQPTGVTIRGTPAMRGQDGVAKIPDETRMLIHRDNNRGS
ncbi:hypothetical protein FANTH_7791 [Fusarium anthophilum]|uniref:Uncharacterized protein n=1 Tax=Fusarium anthophilum TaxID=48485 RepID=A0A8H5E2L8_9HYPO|nr:hypothetical protein FANTH_7791 [Fusarium anthophilum]